MSTREHPASQPKMHRWSRNILVRILPAKDHRPQTFSGMTLRRPLTGSLQFSSKRKIIDGEEDSMRGYPDTLLNDEEEKKEASLGAQEPLYFLLQSKKIV